MAYGAAKVASPERWVAALTADLPALRPADLTDALRAAEVTAPRAGGRCRGFVTDADGSGTTLLTAPPEVPLDPRFGRGSAARHLASSARLLDGDWPSLRRDVDTGADLAEAARLGLGPHTAVLWAGKAG
jgi:2-phospho-L-lactate guanylyltransferase